MDTETIKNECLVLLGALAGGFIGYFISTWIFQQGLYGLILPGAMVGFGTGFFKSRTIIPAIICGFFALFISFFTEWRYITIYGLIRPFNDTSFFYILTHFYQLPKITLIMIVLGTFFGFWVPFRRIKPKGSSGKQEAKEMD